LTRKEGGLILTKFTPQSSAMDRTRDLLRPPFRDDIQVTGLGYGDLLGEVEPPTHRLIQRLMRTDLYSGIYQLGRKAMRRSVEVASKRGTDDRSRIVASLRLVPGATVIDVGCGPGNFTGLFGTAAGEQGLAIGVDASHQMLRVASADNAAANVAYLRADAENLPFAEYVADGVACLAALYLINDPFRTLDEIARVLKPGGHVVILTSLAPGGGRHSFYSKTVEGISGCRMFGRDEIVDHLRKHGFVDVDQHAGGWAQTVVATKPR
jgi:ubiquinone/menaquinone biosynthesis C-methylase UbiE